jgi:hypothetical protein
MLDGAARMFALAIKAKTGTSQTAVLLVVVAAIGSAVAFVFACLIAYILLEQRYGRIEAAVALALAFFAVAVVAIIAAVFERRRAVRRAKAELAARTSALLSDPRLLTAGFQVARSIGWRKVVPLVVVGLLAAGLTRNSTRTSPQR